MEDDTRYMVLTRCYTFNHSSYIVDAMNGFTIQETSFPVISIIVDDASTDGEQGIIRDYITKHFHKPYRLEETDDYYLICAKHKTNVNCSFAVFLLKYNHHSINKSKMSYFSDWFNRAKYYAICEGDDYWIAPNKLQIQVEYLETHIDCELVHARAKIFNQEREQFVGSCGNTTDHCDNILFRNPIVTLTACCSIKLYLDYIAHAKNWNTKGWKMGDYPMWIWMAYHTSIYFIDNEVAVYREVEGSATHPKLLETKLAFLDSTLQIQLFFANMFQKEDAIMKQIEYNSYKNKAIACLNYRNRKLAKQYLKQLSFSDQLKIRLKYKTI